MRPLVYPRTEEELRADGFPEDAIKEVLSGEFDWATTGAIWRAGGQDLDDALQNMEVCNAALAEHDAILHDVEESMVEMKEQMEVIERRVLAKSEEVAFRESKTIATLQRDVLLLRKAHQAVEKAAEASIINDARQRLTNFAARSSSKPAYSEELVWVDEFLQTCTRGTELWALAARYKDLVVRNEQAHEALRHEVVARD